MSLIISSTTNSQQQVEEAAVAGEDMVLVTPASEAEQLASGSEGEGHSTPITLEKVGRGNVATTTDSPEAVREVAEDLAAQREERKEQYLGRSARKRISHLVAEREQARSEADQLRQRLAAYEGQQPQNGNDQQQRSPQAEQQQQPPLTRQQAEAELARFEAEAVQKHHLRQVFDDYNRQVEQARAAHEDFDKVVNTSAQIPISAIHAMYEMDNGAEVAYYLAQHPEVRAELLELNRPDYMGGQRKLLVKLNDISESLSGRAVRQRPVSGAPPPITPVRTGASGTSAGDPAKLPYRDYVKWYGQKYGGGR